MSNDAEQHQQHIKALEDELNHYVQLCQSQKELLHQYILLQKRTLQHLHSRSEHAPNHTKH